MSAIPSLTRSHVEAAIARIDREGVPPRRESTKFQVPGGTLQKTISIGVADFPKDSDTFWQAMKYADVALYQAKERGRNRVVHFAPEMWTADSDY